MNKKGIILATFGSIYGEAVEKSVGKMSERIQQMYPEATVHTVFLADALVEKWNEKYDTPIASLQESLHTMYEKGVEEVFIQPFALVWDQCYQQMRKDIAKFTQQIGRVPFKVSIGKPLLSSLGVKNYADDYMNTIEAIKKHVKKCKPKQVLLLMANGQNQLEYSTLQLKCIYSDNPDVVLFTANGFPSFKQALGLLGHMKVEDVKIVPLALIGSAHLMDYLGGDRSDSISSLLTQEGYNVTVWTEGLGENPYIQELFGKHLSQAIRVWERKKQSKGANDAPF